MPKIYFFKNFKNKNLICAVSTKEIGDLSGKSKNLEKFCKVIKIDPSAVIFLKQIHSNKIKQVSKSDCGKIIENTDGLITTQKNIFLMIKCADCLPLLFFDKSIGIIGAAHAGWRGTSAKIAKEMVKKFNKSGSNPKNVKVGIGPGVCQEHYEVGEEVKNKIKDNKSFRGKNLDLVRANVNQLKKEGIMEKNIEILNICTFEDDNLYSHRKGDKERFGTIIGLSRN